MRGWFALLIVLFASTEVQADWKAEWEKTVAAAKKEGRLNFYVGRYGTEPLLNEFRKEYPEIKIVSVNGTGNQLGSRILAEVRAGNVLADLYSGGANTNFNLLYKGKVLDSIKATLILPEILDESLWMDGAHSYGDPERKHIFVYIANPGGTSVYYHTAQLNPKEFKSYWDLLQPKWKGRVASQDPTSTGLGASIIFFYYNPELGPEFVKRLFGTMDVTYSRDRRQLTDWLAQGRFAYCLGCRDAQRAKDQGLPVDEIDAGDWKEGVSLTTGGGSMSLIKGAPHPNAAKVFTNWFLSRKGQTALQKHKDLYGEDAPNSRRIDIPKDDLPAESKLVKGRKYIDVSRPEWQDMTPIHKLIKEVIKQ